MVAEDNHLYFAYKSPLGIEHIVNLIFLSNRQYLIIGRNSPSVNFHATKIKGYLPWVKIYLKNLRKTQLDQ